VQLIRAAVIAALGCSMVAALGAPALADGTLSMRGFYYKEKATRVIAPMLDATFEVGEEDEADAHALIDAVTSASVASGAQEGDAFSERRYEVGGGYRHRMEETLLGGSVRYSHEPDYTSYFAGVQVERAFAEKNTTLGAMASIGPDSIGSIGAFGAEMHAGDLTSLIGSLSATQVLSPNTIAGLTYDRAHLDGFLSNPYRSAITGDGLVPERNPDERTRHAIAGTVKRFFPETVTTIIATYRFYADTWDIEAHTPELRVVQETGDGVDFTVRYRYHRQSAADFYLPSYPSNDPNLYPYVTDDVKLSKFTTHTVGVKLGVLGEVLGLPGTLEGARGEIILEYIDQNNRFGNAVTAHAALTLPFVY